MSIFEKGGSNNDGPFYHRYEYDAENRLTEAFGSRDKVYWERLAAYNYYRHGPLARMVLGNDIGQVQGIDYAYTLQGWLKGVNSTAVNENTDIGNDGKTGSPNALVTRDAYSFSLNYFGNDYKPINNTISGTFTAIPNNLAATSDGLNVGKDLFNGNIRAMLVNVPQLGEAKLYGYRYDQLNRLVAMNTYNAFNNATNLFTGNTPAITQDYKERVTYDPNGNILSYLRNGDNAQPMDDLHYNYLPNSNQLQPIQPI